MESSAARSDAPPTRFKAANRQLKTLPGQIAEQIFIAIANGEYAPGERIREEALADRLEVSRAPLREAFRILEKDSVVSIVPHRGVHVSQLSIKEVGDIFEVRRCLSGAMIGHLTVDEAASLATLVDADIQALDAPAQDPSAGAAYLQTTFRLSRVVCKACSNDCLAGILDSLARQTLRYTQLGVATMSRRKESARTWRAMLDALKAGDATKAAVDAEHLVDASRHEAVRQLRAAEANAPSKAASEVGVTPSRRHEHAAART